MKTGMICGFILTQKQGVVIAIIVGVDLPLFHLLLHLWTVQQPGQKAFFMAARLLARLRSMKKGLLEVPYGFQK
jgi:hypothetical protein